MKTNIWKLEDKLDAHVQYISGIVDWNAHTNEILTSSQNKTSYVWLYTDKKLEFFKCSCNHNIRLFMLQMELKRRLILLGNKC